jgi:hypothetical protein
MAKFVVNSTATQAIRLASIDAINISELGAGVKFIVNVKVGSSNYAFEQAATLADAQALAAPVITALEA